MGSATSKDSPAAADPSSSSSSSGGPRRLRSGVFSSSCFGLHSALPDEDVVEDENGSAKAGSIYSDEIETKSRKRRSCRLRKMPPLELCDDVERSVEDDDDGVDGESSVRDSRIDLGANSSAGSSNADTAVSSNPSSRSRSRFGLRLSRTISLGSLRTQSLFSVSSDLVHVDSQIEHEESAAGVNDSLQYIVRNNAVAGSVGDDSSLRYHLGLRNEEMRRSSRRIGPQEPLEGSVRFSRTLSVGRLRDRVLRRRSSSAGIFGSALVEDRSAYSGQASERRALGGRRRMPPSSSNDVWPDYLRSHPYHIGSLADGSYDSENGSLQLREGNGHDLLEHGSAFLERRRRIRSQVRALQRLGSRFENLSGHERSCIFSGQHRTGRCTCRTSNRAANPSDDTGARASISRIVMLAEALFEVLDEIHQQSVALTSRPSLSTIGSVPAPKEVVECMPLKVYMKPQKDQNEEAAQCYICLVEYEDGDFMRMLPCNHEFHRTCIDKWLKEIHRVCPLCRGDVCRSEVSGTNK